MLKEGCPCDNMDDVNQKVAEQAYKREVFGRRGVVTKTKSKQVLAIYLPHPAVINL